MIFGPAINLYFVLGFFSKSEAMKSVGFGELFHLAYSIRAVKRQGFKLVLRLFFFHSNRPRQGVQKAESPAACWFSGHVKCCFPGSLLDDLPRGCSLVGLPWDARLVKFRAGTRSRDRTNFLFPT